MAETDKPAVPEQLQVPEGLSAMFLPDLGGRDPYGDLEPAKPNDVLAKTNSFLQRLNQAGADIKAVIPVEVDMGVRGGIVGHVTETKQLLILRR